MSEVFSSIHLQFIKFGKLFQNIGPTTLNDPNANVFLTVFGIIRWSLMLLDLRVWFVSEHLISIFLKYSGTSPLKHLKTSVRILNLILGLISSQCNSANDCVLLSYFVLPRNLVP